jgi:hypothetical protein
MPTRKYFISGNVFPKFMSCKSKVSWLAVAYNLLYMLVALLEKYYLSYGFTVMKHNVLGKHFPVCCTLKISEKHIICIHTDLLQI